MLTNCKTSCCTVSIRLHPASLSPVLSAILWRILSLSSICWYRPKNYSLKLCADELVVGGGVGWSYDRRRRRAAHFSSAAAASAASDRMRDHWNSALAGQAFFWFYRGQPLHLWSLLGRWRRKVNCEYACCAQFHSRNKFLEAHINAMLSDRWRWCSAAVENAALEMWE